MSEIDAGDETRTEIVFDRADSFRAAHALVFSLNWPGEAPAVYDVLQVAKFLEEE